jgi:uncharacterized RDD family membrane protein YckC
MQNVSLIKRIIVMIYDGFLLVGVTLVGYALLFLLMSALPAGFEGSALSKAVKVAYLIGISFAFYAWFWTHGGQTLGMKVWNLYLVDNNGKFVTWGKSVVRYLGAMMSWGLLAGILFLADVERWYLAIGLGFVWSLFNRNRLSWHDALSGSRIVQMPTGDKKTKTKETS